MVKSRGFRHALPNSPILDPPERSNRTILTLLGKEGPKEGPFWGGGVQKGGVPFGGVPHFGEGDPKGGPIWGVQKGSKRGLFRGVPPKSKVK